MSKDTRMNLGLCACSVPVAEIAALVRPRYPSAGIKTPSMGRLPTPTQIGDSTHVTRFIYRLAIVGHVAK